MGFLQESGGQHDMQAVDLAFDMLGGTAQLTTAAAALLSLLFYGHDEDSGTKINIARS
ncbi:hypothetical protein [uncultured Oceanisphaera sp.]|uniref:hypothetical protein n=1 Tax=uncultured Oceanisphaera sp. TaxID=353858 RepID=UPI002632449E|nr:hypothetical protein [uncultured Oceanisphaera sp.]